LKKTTKFLEIKLFALGIAAEIPALRVCSAICSTDCHAPLAMTDCSEKPDPCGNAQILIFFDLLFRIQSNLAKQLRNN